MSFQKTYRLMIEPVAQIVTVQSEAWMMSATLTEEYLIELGKKKNKEQSDKGAKHPVAVNYYLNKRKRYLKYANWKEELKREATRQLYFPRTDNFWVKFFIPMPDSWSPKKKRTLEFQPHLQRSDCDNFFKAFSDALFSEDSIVWDFRASKFWAAEGSKGYIEIELGTLPPAKGYSKWVKEDVLK